MPARSCPGQLPNLVGPVSEFFPATARSQTKSTFYQRPCSSEARPPAVACGHSWHRFDPHRLRGVNIVLQGFGLFRGCLNQVEDTCASAVRLSASTIDSRLQIDSETRKNLFPQFDPIQTSFRR